MVRAPRRVVLLAGGGNLQKDVLDIGRGSALLEAAGQLDLGMQFATFVERPYFLAIVGGTQVCSKLTKIIGQVGNTCAG